MSHNPHGLAALSEAQREIMDIVWERGEVAASEVRDILGKTRSVARNTIRTLLERMEEKGWLKHREEGRTYLYSPTVPRETTVGWRVVEVLNQACGGSPEALMTALLDYRGLSKAELERVRKMLDAAPAARKGPGNAKGAAR